jgi:hypothetical protein
LAGIKTALTTCAPDLDDKEAENVAAVVLSNMKTMAGMAKKDGPTTPGRSWPIAADEPALSGSSAPARSADRAIADKLKGRSRAARNS